MSTKPFGRRILDSADSSSFLPNTTYDEADPAKRTIVPLLDGHEFADELDDAFLQAREIHSQRSSTRIGLSRWSRSAAKRSFDCACVLLFLPVLVPVMLVIGAAVRLTSSGPVFFFQERVGRYGRTFTIFKFRSMIVADAAHHPITTSDNQSFTRVGPFLRRWKLDELPQLINVLLGHMSLVGPRPKMPEHALFDLPCRPGITGLATTVFACEERILACVPKDRLDAYFHSVVLPAKRRLDAQYMTRATFFSDIRLLMNSVLRRWDTTALDEFIAATAFEVKEADAATLASKPERMTVQIPIPLRMVRNVEPREASVR